jgi:hypothetical protein
VQKAKIRDGSPGCDVDEIFLWIQLDKKLLLVETMYLTNVHQEATFYGKPKTHH